jgi:hypothetical protein
MCRISYVQKGIFNTGYCEIIDNFDNAKAAEKLYIEESPSECVIPQKLKISEIPEFPEKLNMDYFFTSG